MKHETITYQVGSHFMPFLINCDYSGLTKSEQSNILEFDIQASIYAQTWKQHISHHWSANDDESFYGVCDVTGIFGDLSKIELLIMSGE